MAEEVKSRSSAKSNVIIRLKREGEVSLEDLSYGLGISKVATLKHLTKMEEHGLVKRRYISSGRGRPRCLFSLTHKGEDSLPRNYSDIAVEALAFVDKKFGREFVAEILRLRTQKIVSSYRDKLKDMEREESMISLSRLRDSEGYMSSWRQIDDTTFEFVEYNCPILGVSQNYSEACAAEGQLFKESIRANVESTHRVVAGEKSCRFLIKFQNPLEKMTRKM